MKHTFFNFFLISSIFCASFGAVCSGRQGIGFSSTEIPIEIQLDALQRELEALKSRAAKGSDYHPFVAGFLSGWTNTSEINARRAHNFYWKGIELFSNNYTLEQDKEKNKALFQIFFFDGFLEGYNAKKNKQRANTLHLKNLLIPFNESFLKICKRLSDTTGEISSVELEPSVNPEITATQQIARELFITLCKSHVLSSKSRNKEFGIDLLKLFKIRSLLINRDQYFFRFSADDDQLERTCTITFFLPLIRTFEAALTDELLSEEATKLDAATQDQLRRTSKDHTGNEVVEDTSPQAPSAGAGANLSKSAKKRAQRQRAAQKKAAELQSAQPHTESNSSTDISSREEAPSPSCMGSCSALSATPPEPSEPASISLSQQAFWLGCENGIRFFQTELKEVSDEERTTKYADIIKNCNDNLATCDAETDTPVEEKLEWLGFRIMLAAKNLEEKSMGITAIDIKDEGRAEALEIYSMLASNILLQEQQSSALISCLYQQQIQKYIKIYRTKRTVHPMVHYWQSFKNMFERKHATAALSITQRPLDGSFYHTFKATRNPSLSGYFA